MVREARSFLFYRSDKLNSKMRIVSPTYGSLGDLHPLIAVGLELRERGHDVVFATNFSHEERVTRHGFEFHSIRRHQPEDPPPSPI